ncbi:MAG: hypothetical protein K2G20_00610 [Lachnospiraceae bacterium]|nr:hypothetical protein [Lachnospiraceae bacterium]
MDYIYEMQKIAKANGGIIDNKTAASVGISRAMLSKFCKENKIQRLVRGQYILSDDIQDELLSIELRSKQLIFSHETALFLHGISDRMPFEHSVTAPSNKVPSKAIQQDCKIYYIKPELFELGKTKLSTQFGNEVTVYDLERTICDVIRSRNKVGSETFLAALKMYAANPNKNLNKLNNYAKEMRIAGIVRKYMEVIL